MPPFKYKIYKKYLLGHIYEKSWVFYDNSSSNISGLINITFYESAYIFPNI